MNLLIHPNRNCGFMWEPGAFVGILMSILYLNNNFSIKNRKLNSLILILGILSTISIMGYLSLIVNLFSKVKLKNKLLSIFILFLLVLGVYFLSKEIPFLREKIINQIVNLDLEVENVTRAIKSRYITGLTRFGSIFVDWDVFVNNL
jgi:hypothetical protein